jgi:uncharacterized cupredoxin-like copper-binding protein
MSRRYVVATTIAAACLAAPVAVADGTPTARSSATTVSVTGKEFKFTLSPSSAKAGKVTFRFTNKGRLKHDFKIAGKQTKVLSAGKSQSLSVTLKKGSYSYLCTVKGHASAGMKGSFRVR